MSAALVKTKEVLPGRKECTCGGNKNCFMCDGKGWIDPEDTTNPVPWDLPPAKPSQPDTWGKPRPSHSRAKSPKQPGQVNKTAKVAKKTKITKISYKTLKVKKVPGDIQKSSTSITVTKKDGRKKDIPVTYKKKEKLKNKPTVSELKKPDHKKSIHSKKSSTKAGKNKRDAKTASANKEKVSRSSRKNEQKQAANDAYKKTLGLATAGSFDTVTNPRPLHGSFEGGKR